MRRLVSVGPPDLSVAPWRNYRRISQSPARGIPGAIELSTGFPPISPMDFSKCLVLEYSDILTRSAFEATLRRISGWSELELRLSQVELMLITLFEHNHWTLGVIDIKCFTFSVVDSYKEGNNSHYAYIGKFTA